MTLVVLFVNESYSLISIVGSLLLIFSLMITFFDLDDSGVIDIEDYRILKNKMDLNNDGKIDEKDLILFLKNRINHLKTIFVNVFK